MIVSGESTHDAHAIAGGDSEYAIDIPCSIDYYAFTLGTIAKSSKRNFPSVAPQNHATQNRGRLTVGENKDCSHGVSVTDRGNQEFAQKE